MATRNIALALMLLSSLTSSGCGSGGNTPPPADTPTPTAMSVSGVVAASNGIFDASPRNDGSGNLWMSFSTVDFSANEPTLTEVRTRIASSADGGTTWTDAGVDPNNNSAPDLLVPNPLGAGNVWADWHYEVSSLLYDPIDPDTTRRWKMLWHRMLYVSVGGDSVMSVDNSWIGLSTASTPDGVWSSERKLFAGSLYNAAVNVVISAPEKQLNALHAPLSNCLAFTEPSMLAKADDIYISLHCLGGASNSKIFGMRCDRSFSTCTYLGDFLQGSEAAQFSQSGQSFSGFSATELVSVGGNDYLVVTPTETSGDTYRGCLAFRISDLATATLARTNGVPTLIKRISGTSGSFNGACGYDADATGSGIIYSEANASAPNFRMFASHISLP